MSTSYRITLRCTDCAHRWRRTVTSPDEPDPPCPACAKRTTNIGLNIAEGKVPAIGGNIVVRAMDDTMEAVASDYKMTDLRTDGREGETMAPKLPPQQQAAADAMFDPNARRKVLNPATAAKMNAITRTAYAGGYVQPADRDPIKTAHAGRPRGAVPIKANIVAGDGVR